MKRILSLGVLAALGVLMGCPIYGDDHGTTGPGDCTENGCPNGYTCTLSDGVAACVANSSGDSGTDSPSTHPYSGCFADTDCSEGGAGAKCLAGTTSGGTNDVACTTTSNQCFDETQCTTGNCVQGVCTPSCSATSPCPTGFGCDSNGECTLNSTACTVPGGACGTNGICIEQHCVSQCGTGGTCASGLICVNGGCMPDQQPVFTCHQEGVQDSCATGSICIHHDCYISCAGSNSNACQTADQFNVCKSVTTQTGSYQVCGSSSNLGSDCDPTIGKNCPNSGVCIDGYCH